MYDGSFSDVGPIKNIKSRAQLFKTNDVVSERIVKTLIIRYGIYANIFS